MRQARLVPLLILAASVVVVGGALLSQYVGGLQPCELCLYQRWPYYAAIVLTGGAAALGRQEATRAVVALCALLFLAGGVVAFYHVGVEQKWFAGPTACTAPSLTGGSIADLKAQLLATPPVRCDEVQWSLFGISLAGWNLLASFVLVIFCVAALLRPGYRMRAA